ncbi:IS3 family transposase [Limosilactobacillus reuteri]|uniref:IS3 family transposase n=1 Tax=Limosilactobacillus reuteri TaxID=1598 RepID=UPI002AAB27C2|nr:IS3 family transposase [Limosilactobacillus reuteri]WPU43630.1 IS3 family transposase [Limosilactobacillus reuteri]
MTKISIKTKLKAVEEYANGDVTLASVRHKYGIAELVFQIWVGIYARFGKGPLLNPPKVTGDFRLNLVKWKQENLASISETCICFGYRSPGSVYQWECLYNKQGSQALLGLRRGRKPKNDQPTRQASSRRITPTPKAVSSPTKRKLIVKDTTRRLKKIDSLEKASKKELAQVIYELKAKYLLKDLIDALPISMSTYQYWQNKFEHPNEDEEELKAVIQGLFDYYEAEYGVRRLSSQVRAYYRLIGKEAPNHKRVQRLMHEMGLKCTKYNRRIRKYDSSKGPNGKKAKNRLNRRFMSNRKYQKMVCDITELKTHNRRKVYLEIIKDLATNQILTWAISQHPNLQFALTPLQRLLKQLPHTGYQLTLHTDQGWHYQHRVWRKLLRQGNIRQSMSHRATCLDNAACETVFSKLKAEIGPDTSYRNQEELSQAINEWIHFYNERRIQTKLGDQTPLQYEQNLVA